MSTANSISAQLKANNFPCISSAIIESEHACKYLNVLCRHFGRKVEAEWDEFQGMVKFSIGTTVMVVNPSANQLTISCHAENQTMLEDQTSTIDRHVTLFARRELIELSWSK